MSDFSIGADFPFNNLARIPSEESDGRAMEQTTFDRPPIDRSVFDRLVLEHLDGASRFATRLCGNASDAEDVVQDALLRTHQSWKSFRGESKFRTWFFQIVINCFRDHLERTKAQIARNEPLRGDVEQSSASDPRIDAQSKELGDLVASEVSRLPPRQREVLVMSAYEQMNHAEIAGALSMTEQNVRTTLHLARERLRERLAKFLVEPRR